MGLDIIRHRNLIISRQLRPVFVGKVQRLVFFSLRKRDRMPTSVKIRISSTSFVKVFTANGSSICFWGFCLPPVTPYMSCPKELTSRRTRWEYSVVISVISVRTVQRKASSSGGRLTAFSYSSDGFVGHYVLVLFERTVSRMYRPISCISLTLDLVSPCLIAEITLLFGRN